MDNKEIYFFLAQSLSDTLGRHSEQVRKKNEKLVKDILREGDYGRYTQVMAGIVAESVEVMKEWEKTGITELEGKAPSEYFSSIKTVDDAVELVAVMLKKNEGMLPPSLTESINKLGESIMDEIIIKVNSIMPGKDENLTSEQKAVLKIVEMIASEKLTEPLSRLLFRLDVNTANEGTIESIMDALKAVGKPSIQCLIALCEKCGHKGIIYMHSIVTLSEIASKNKSEEIYRYLKECFRKSEAKLVEASALGLYGDGRAVAALRTHVERNISSMVEREYTAYRDIILQLGGLMSDLDRKYMSANRQGK